MKTLCMDSAHKHLILVLLEDGKCKAATVLACWKKQSETLFPELIKLCDSIAWDSDDIDEVMITDGPGSYTGVRIAMAIAKVYCTTKQKPLFCISTLQLYAGGNDHTFVMLDARSKRAYCGLYHKGVLIGEERILTLDEIKEELSKHEAWKVVGDCDLLGLPAKEIEFAKNFEELRAFARPVENIHTLTPRYLKDADAYKIK